MSISVEENNPIVEWVDEHVVLLWGVHDTPEVRAAARGIVEVMSIGKPLVVFVDQRVATIHAVERDTLTRREPEEET